MTDDMIHDSFNLDEFMAEAGRLRTAYIPAEELGLSKGVWIKELTGRQRDEVIKRGGKLVMHDSSDTTELDLSSTTGASSLIASYCLVTDKTGSTRMFRKSDDPALKRISGRVLDVITKRCRELSGLTKESSKQAKKQLVSLNGDSGLN